MCSRRKSNSQTFVGATVVVAGVQYGVVVVLSPVVEVILAVVVEVGVVELVLVLPIEEMVVRGLSVSNFHPPSSAVVVEVGAGLDNELRALVLALVEVLETVDADSVRSFHPPSPAVVVEVGVELGLVVGVVPL